MRVPSKPCDCAACEKARDSIKAERDRLRRQINDQYKWIHLIAILAAIAGSVCVGVIWCSNSCPQVCQ